MRKTWKFAAILTAFAMVTANPAQASSLVDDFRVGGKAPSTKIVGGVEADISDAPWQVALISSGAGDDFNGQFCGGSILNSGWVITAAHCVDWGITANQLRIMYGSDFLSNSSLSNNRVSSIIIHENWNPDTNDNDIALIKLASPMTLTSDVAESISLPAARPVVGSEALISGWGNVSNSGSSYPQAMQKALVDIYADSYCQDGDIYGPTYSPNLMLCASADDFSRDTCQGDSGGPLAMFIGGKWELQGITSYGTGCAESPYPGVYTEVFQYISWINSKIYVKPSASNLSPSSARVGDTVTLSGRNLLGVSAVTVNGVSVPSADITVSSNTSLTFVVPAGATTGRVRVTNPAGSASTNRDLRILPPVGYPVINSLNPSRARVGATVTLRGENFMGTTAVLVNGTSASFSVTSATQLTFVVPGGASSGKISVTNGLGTSLSDTNLTIRR